MALVRLSTGLIFSDNFNRADGAPGANWSIGAGAWDIFSNRLRSIGGAGADYFIRPTAGAAPYSMDRHCQVITERNNLGNFSSLVTRHNTFNNWYLGDVGASSDGTDPNKTRLYRYDSGYTRIGGGVAIGGVPVVNTPYRLTLSAIGNVQQLWVNGVSGGKVADQTLNNQTPGGELFGAFFAAGGTTYYDDFVTCSARVVIVTGLPTGYKVRAGGGAWSELAVAGAFVVADPAGALMPFSVEVADTVGTIVDTFASAYGGDHFDYGTSSMPKPATGILRTTIDPEMFPAATKVNATALTAANTPPLLEWTSLIGNPTFRTLITDSGRAAIRTVAGAAGFYIPRPVMDDWTMYLVVRNVTGAGAGAQWYQNGTLASSEAGGVVNDFGMTVRGDGKLVAGTGGDVSNTGTHPISGAALHIVVFKRTKSTGRIQVWVDDVLDIDFTNNVNQLKASPWLYFGNGADVNGASVDYARVDIWDAAHSDADRLAMTAAMLAVYSGNPIAMAMGPFAIAAVGSMAQSATITAAMKVGITAVGTLTYLGNFQMAIGGFGISGELGTEDNPYPLGRREVTADFSGRHATNISTVKRPDAISFDYLSAFSMGPQAIGNISSGATDRPWYVRVDNDLRKVYLAKANDLNTAWEAETVLFSFSGVEIEEIDVAFDQSGNVTVCAERKSGAGGAKEVWLYWFKPLAGAFVFEMVEAGRTPRILLDNPPDPTNSDLTLFYLKTGVGLVYRVQREVYAIAHATPHLVEPDWYIEDAFYTKGYRVAVFMVLHNPGGTYGKKRLESSLMPIYMIEPFTLEGHVDRGTIRNTLFIFTDDPAYVDTKVGPMLKGDYFTYGGSVASGLGTLAATLLQHVLYDIEKFTLGGTIDTAALTDSGINLISHDLYDIEKFLYNASIAPGGNTLAAIVIVHDLYDIEKFIYNASFGAGGTLA